MYICQNCKTTVSLEVVVKFFFSYTDKDGLLTFKEKWKSSIG